MNTARKLLFVTSLCLTWCIRTDAQSVKYDSDGKLKIFARNVDSLSKAFSILKKL